MGCTVKAVEGTNDMLQPPDRMYNFYVDGVYSLCTCSLLPSVDRVDCRR
jgi:hypothetical protein